MFNTLRPRQHETILQIISKCIFFKRLIKSMQCVPTGLVDYKTRIGSGNGLAPSRHQAITWVSGNPGQWCIYASLGLIELITLPYWENVSTRRKRYCLSTRWIPSPHSWKRAIPTRQVGSGRRTGWPWFVNSPLVTVVYDGVQDNELSGVLCATSAFLYNVCLFVCLLAT